MPVALDPKEIYRYVISTDRELPADQPTLLFHYPTCREAAEIARLFDASDMGKSPAEVFKLCADAIKIILVGWENFKDRKGNDVAFNPADLDAILTHSDFLEMRARLLEDMSNAELQKKSSALLRELERAKSAKSVTANA